MNRIIFLGVRCPRLLLWANVASLALAWVTRALWCGCSAFLVLDLGSGCCRLTGLLPVRCSCMLSCLQAKEEDKSQLLGMCNDLMTRLEREGLSA